MRKRLKNLLDYANNVLKSRADNVVEPHGIDKDAPTFKQLMNRLKNFTNGCTVAALLLLVCSGCDHKQSNSPSSSPASQNGPVKIGFIVKQPEEPWFQLEWKFAGEAAKQDGFDLVKIGA